MEVSWTISMCHIPKALQSTGHLWLPPQSGQRAASPKGHSRHLQSASYSSSIKTDLFYCVLKISAPDLSLFLHWQKDVSTALPRKQSLGFDRWMEVGAGLVCCGKYVSWMFLLNWALEKELPTFLHLQERTAAAVTDPLTAHEPSVPTACARAPREQPPHPWEGWGLSLWNSALTDAQQGDDVSFAAREVSDAHGKGVEWCCCWRGEESCFCPFYNKTSLGWISHGFNWIVCYC